jgi:glutathione S-transferase
MGQDPAAREFLVGLATRWLAGLERQLQGHDWITGDDFTIADLLLASVLRQLRHTDLMDGYPNVKAFYERAMARPAWRRTLDLYAERLGADRAKIG